ncbi:MAG: hypothetical protein ACRDS9_05555 [Pseudonocardiaceae bacterium]
MRVFDRLYRTRSEAVSLAEWVSRVRDAGKELAILPYQPTMAELAAGSEHRPLKYTNEPTRRDLARLGVSIPSINEALIARYWRYLEQTGYLS